MLILTRKTGEGITIGEEIVVSVLEVRGSQVRLGITAPPSITIHRGEVYERIREENLRASALDLSQTEALSQQIRVIFPESALPKKPSTV